MPGNTWQSWSSSLRIQSFGLSWVTIPSGILGRDLVLDREKSSPVSPLGATCQAVSLVLAGGDSVPPGGFLAPSRLVLPPGCCQTWQWEGNSLERGVTQIRERNTAC